MDYILKAIGDKKVDEHDSYLPRLYALDDVEIPEYKHVGPVIGTVKIEEKKGVFDLMKEIADEVKENNNMKNDIVVEFQGLKCNVEMFRINHHIDQPDQLEVICTIPTMVIPTAGPTLADAYYRKDGTSCTTTIDKANDDHIPKIKEVIFNPPATIVFWKDGTKSVVKATNEEFDPEKGLAMAIARKVYGNKHDYYNRIAKWTKRYKKPESQKAVEMGKALAEGFNKGLEEVEKKTAKPVATAKRVVDPKAKSGKR